MPVVAAMIHTARDVPPADDRGHFVAQGDSKSFAFSLRKAA